MSVATVDELEGYLLDDYTINVDSDLAMTSTLSMTGDTGVSECRRATVTIVPSHHRAVVPSIAPPVDTAPAATRRLRTTPTYHNCSLAHSYTFPSSPSRVHLAQCLIGRTEGGE